MEPRLFDLDILLIADSVLMIIALLFLIAIALGIVAVIKTLIKYIREK